MNEQQDLASEARVSTSRPGRYMEQLCKHFEHKIPVTRGENGNSITFAAGTCDVSMTDDVLVLKASAADAAALATVEDVVARHLQRFMFRETPTITWARLS